MAIKIYEKYKIQEIQRKRTVTREIKILKKLTHPNIATLYDAIDNPRQLYLVMDMVDGQSL